MAAAGKKGKKGKVVMSLSEFQGATTGSFVEKKISSQSWADVMDDLPVPYMKNEAVVLPTAPKAARSSDVDTSRVPKVPPFKIYMGNIPYDIEENVIKDFFSPHETVQVEIPKGDKGSRGFGYVEFRDREGLIAALAKDGVNLGQRNVRISLPEEGGKMRDGDRGRRDGGMGGMDRDPGRTDNDWRREPRELPPVKADQFAPRDSSLRGGGFDRMGGSGFDRMSGSGGGFDRMSGTGGSGFERNRNGGGSGFQPYQPSNRMDSRPDSDFDNVRRQDPSFGPSSSWEKSQDTRPRFVPAHDRPSFNDSYQNRYHQDARSEQTYLQQQPPYNDSPREYQRPPRDPQTEPVRTDEAAREAPVERKRLQLQPRSKPKEEIAAPAEITRSSIFGDAKPVDTTKKELEIEEKLKTTTEPDPPSEDGTRMRRTSTGSGKSGTRSRQTSESGSHHSPRESAPTAPRTGFNRHDSDRSQGDRRPPRILTNPDRDRNFGSHRDDRRDHYDRRENHDRRDHYDRGNSQQYGSRGGYSDRRPMDRRDGNNRFDNNGRGHYDNSRGGGPRHYQDDQNRNNDRNNDRRERQPRPERPDRPRNDAVRGDKEPVNGARSQK